MVSALPLFAGSFVTVTVSNYTRPFNAVSSAKSPRKKTQKSAKHKEYQNRLLSCCCNRRNGCNDCDDDCTVYSLSHIHYRPSPISITLICCGFLVTVQQVEQQIHNSLTLSHSRLAVESCAN